MLKNKFAPLTRDATRVYLSRTAGGFDLRGCPEPEELAELIVTAVNAYCSAPQVPATEKPNNGWLEAARAWEVCASIHAQFGKGKDAIYRTRQEDFNKHAERCRATALQAPAETDSDYADLYRHLRHNIPTRTETGFNVYSLKHLKNMKGNELDTAIRAAMPTKPVIPPAPTKPDSKHALFSAIMGLLRILEQERYKAMHSDELKKARCAALEAIGAYTNEREHSHG